MAKKMNYEKHTKAELNEKLGTMSLSETQLKKISKGNLILLVVQEERARAEEFAAEVEAEVQSDDPLDGLDELCAKRDALLGLSGRQNLPEFLKEKTPEEHDRLEREYEMKQACLAYATAKADATGKAVTTFEDDLEVSSDNPAFVLNHESHTAYEMDQHEAGWLVADESKEAYKSLSKSKGIAAKKTDTKKGTPSQRTTKVNPLTVTITEMIDKGEYTMWDIADACVETHGANRMAVARTCVGAKNPKYNRYRTLVVSMENKEGKSILYFDDDKRVKKEEAKFHAQHPWNLKQAA